MKLLSAEEYLAHHYELPKKIPRLPLPDENFISAWTEQRGAETLNFLEKIFELPVHRTAWQNLLALRIEFNRTFTGKLPVIKTANHYDFCEMVSLLSGCPQKKFPLNVNAFTILCRAEKIFGHKVILLNEAPYSNVAAEELGLTQADRLRKSYLIRLRHESAHYETLRLLGGMKNHILDEILADVLGQISAFGNFDADRQRLFFGLRGEECDGRLQFYCRNILPDDLPKVYRATNFFLEKVSELMKNYQDVPQKIFELYARLICHPLNFNAERNDCRPSVATYPFRNWRPPRRKR